MHRHPQHIPEIDAKDFSFETFRAATDDWRHPAVVRGFFNGVPAMSKWTELDYLPREIGDFNIPVVRNAIVGTMQNNRDIVTFRDAFTEVITQEDSKSYIFFPVKSRFNFNGSDLGRSQLLQKKVSMLHHHHHHHSDYCSSILTCEK